MFDPQRFVQISSRAAVASMRTVHQEQISFRSDFQLDVSKKSDDTIVTQADHRSQLAAVRVIRNMDHDSLILGEEDRTITDDSSDGWLVDPLDGTSAFALGLVTSTVIIAYREDGVIKGCTIGEPASGRIWTTNYEGQCWFSRLHLNGEVMSFGPRMVWEGDLGRDSTVFLDVSHGFRDKTTDAGIGWLFDVLNHKSKLLMPGSNGLIQAMVANGGHGVAGSVSTALGGAWDAAGVLLVLAAGGCAKAFKFDKMELVEHDPLRIGEYDILVCANNENTLSELSKSVLRTL